MAINLEVDKVDDSSTIAELENELNNYKAALDEAYRAIRWYVTTIALAILTHDDSLIINNNLLSVLEKRFEGKEVNFDVKEIEDKKGMVRVFIKYTDREESKDETIPESTGD